MKDFAALFATLDQTTRTNTKVAALAGYFRTAPEADRLWTIALFSGRRPKRAITTTRLREWAAERAGIPLWLFEESYPIVGDLAETIALVLPPPSTSQDASLAAWIDRLRALKDAEDASRKAQVLAAWEGMTPLERLVFNKLLTGGFRVGISRKLMTRALAQAAGGRAHLALPDLTRFHPRQGQHAEAGVGAEQLVGVQQVVDGQHPPPNLKP